MHMQEDTLNAKPQIYDSLKRGPVAWEELRGLAQYKDLIYQLVRRDVVSRYKRSALGIAWTMLYPLGMMIVLTVVFSQLFHSVQGYPAYVLCGLVAWTFFSQTTSAAMTQMVWGSSLLQRIYMPRTAFVVSAIGTGLVNLALSLIPLLLDCRSRRPPFALDAALPSDLDRPADGVFARRRSALLRLGHLLPGRGRNVSGRLDRLALPDADHLPRRSHSRDLSLLVLSS